MNCKIISSAKLPIAVIAIALMIFGAYKIANFQSSKNEISFDEAITRIKSKEIKAVNLKGDRAKLKIRTGGELTVSGLSEAEKDGITAAVGTYNSENYKDGIALNWAAANPMDRIFQLIFILFFISPPLIVFLLFLIWREMKARNEK